MAICAALNVWFGWRHADLGAGMWMRSVVVPFTAVTGTAALAGALPRLTPDPGFFRVCATSCATSLVFASAAGAWWWRMRRHQ